MPFGLDDVQDEFPVYLRGQYLLCISTKSPCPKAKPCTHIALVNESTIPPMHFPAEAPLLRSHHLPLLYLASVRRRRNGSVSGSGISRSCWRDRHCCWWYTEMKSCCMRAKYLSMRKDVERMGPYLVGDRL